MLSSLKALINLYFTPHTITANKLPLWYTMRRALSLLALGITLALKRAESMASMTITSIKAVDVMRDNKDQWRVKGYFNDPDGVDVPAISTVGIRLDLENGSQDTVTDVSLNRRIANRSTMRRDSFAGLRAPVSRLRGLTGYPRMP